MQGHERVVFKPGFANRHGYKGDANPLLRSTGERKHAVHIDNLLGLYIAKARVPCPSVPGVRARFVQKDRRLVYGIDRINSPDLPIIKQRFAARRNVVNGK